MSVPLACCVRPMPRASWCSGRGIDLRARPICCRDPRDLRPLVERVGSDAARTLSKSWVRSAMKALFSSRATGCDSTSRSRARRRARLQLEVNVGRAASSVRRGSADERGALLVGALQSRTETGCDSWYWRRRRK